jgi:hypothetical protein
LGPPYANDLCEIETLRTGTVCHCVSTLQHSSCILESSPGPRSERPRKSSKTLSSRSIQQGISMQSWALSCRFSVLLAANLCRFRGRSAQVAKCKCAIECKVQAFSGYATYLRQEQDEVEHAEHSVAGLLHGSCGNQRQSVSEVPQDGEAQASKHSTILHGPLKTSKIMPQVQIRKAVRFRNLLHFRN